MSALTIGKLAAETGVNVETVRYYQRIGLLREPEKTGGFRHYGPDHLARLRFIRRAKEGGFSLEEIRSLLELDEVTERGRIRALAQHRLAEIEQRMVDMQALAEHLRQLIDRCEHATPDDCCPIIETFS
jgi:MerR family mercuric resistance operon transcriptional regulator